MQRKTMPTISFRLDPINHERLQQVAFKSGTSMHEAARRLVSDALSDNDSARMKQKLEGLEGEMERLRRGLANGVEALLTVSEKVSKEEASGWVDKHIRS